MEIEKVKCSTPDFAEENAAKLLKLFPECEGEKGTVDLDKLRQVLSSKVIEGNVERQDGLWAQWDGVENAGRGVHDATATSGWKDLLGNADHDLLPAGIARCYYTAENFTEKNFFGVSPGGSSRGNFYLNAVRFYTRLLSDEERDWNAHVDRCRFSGEPLPESASAYIARNLGTMVIFR